MSLLTQADLQVRREEGLQELVDQNALWRTLLSRANRSLSPMYCSRRRGIVLEALPLGEYETRQGFGVVGMIVQIVQHEHVSGSGIWSTAGYRRSRTRRSCVDIGKSSIEYILDDKL